MGRNASVAKVICFSCRESTCGCVAQHNLGPANVPEPSQIARAVAWLGGACVAGGALGGAIAFLLGG